MAIAHVNHIIQGLNPLFLQRNSSDWGGKLLIDYKFYCINGIPQYVQVMSDRVPNTHEVKVSLLDMNWESHPEYCSYQHQQAVGVNKPDCFVQMKEIASALSLKFPFVRIDFYEIDGKPLFGEMTFTPGFDTVNMSFEKFIGEQIKL